MEKTSRRDELIDDEKQIQAITKYESEPDYNKPKYFCTFPYQYQNGTSHLGHAYTISKDEFNARFMHLNGYNVLFPIGFHGTGMPIVSCANKLQESLIKYGDITNLDMTTIPMNDQIRILYNMNVKREEIPKFIDPYYWLKYFPERGFEDLSRFGICADFRRSFITTDMNPYYDAFIKWQFQILNQKNYLKFGKKPIIYSPKDGQPCADHDRTEQGEGVDVKEFHVYYGKCVDQTIILTCDTVLQKEIKAIVVDPTNNFIVFEIEGSSFVAQKEFIRNLKYQTDKIVTCISEMTGDSLIGQTVDINGQLVPIQKSNIPNINGSGFKVLFHNKDQEIKTSEFIYYEPEKPVTSRSGDQCVVALIDQWFIDYSSPDIKKIVNDYIMSDEFTTTENCKKMLIETSNWITFWPCSRTKGLGTKLLDTEYLIDSLSDSTIYMAYYTIAHKITKIPIDVIQKHGFDIFEYIFRNGEMPLHPDIGFTFGIFLKEMKNEFNYWYPFDIRVSGKDLIGNHLVMCLYTHAMIFDKKFFPKSYYVNGHIKLNGEKMSKSTGNFLTLSDAMTKYGTDAVRLTLAEAGTGMDDANFTDKNGTTAILRLSIEKEWCLKLLNRISESNLLTELTIWDHIFEQELNQCLADVTNYYKKMEYQKVISHGFNKIQSIRDNYRNKYESKIIPFSKQHMIMYLEKFLLITYPICPHFVTNLWQIAESQGISLSRVWPTCINVEKEILYIKDVFDQIVTEIRSSISNMNKRYIKKGIHDQKFTVHVYFFTDFIGIEREILDQLIEGKKIVPTESETINKKMVGQICRFTTFVESIIEKYGFEWLKTDYNRIYSIIYEWIHKLCTDAHIGHIDVHNGSNQRVIFQDNPFNPIIKVEV